MHTGRFNKRFSHEKWGVGLTDASHR
jgi:hypothetical protein